jgi:hypothetical protein
MINLPIKMKILPQKRKKFPKERINLPQKWEKLSQRNYKNNHEKWIILNFVLNFLTPAFGFLNEDRHKVFYIRENFLFIWGRYFFIWENFPFFGGEFFCGNFFVGIFFFGIPFFGKFFYFLGTFLIYAFK